MPLSEADAYQLRRAARTDLDHAPGAFAAASLDIHAPVVGVNCSLALFPAYHALRPGGLHGTFDWMSAAMTVAGAVALFRFKRTVIQLICCSALLGLALKLTRS